MRKRQEHVLNEIGDGYNSGYDVILLQAPVGFGKSAISVAVGLGLGSSYTITATNNLQAQYKKDFPWMKIALGMQKYECPVNQDFITAGTYKCKPCGIETIQDLQQKKCNHRTVSNGPCHSEPEFTDKGYRKKHDGCRYKIYLQDYDVANKGTRNEIISIDPMELEDYRYYYDNWNFIENLKTNVVEMAKKRGEIIDKDDIVIRDHHIPCGYYNDLNIALSA